MGTVTSHCAPWPSRLVPWTLGRPEGPAGPRLPREGVQNRDTSHPREFAEGRPRREQHRSVPGPPFLPLTGAGGSDCCPLTGELTHTAARRTRLGPGPWAWLRLQPTEGIPGQVTPPPASAAVTHFPQGCTSSFQGVGKSWMMSGGPGGRETAPWPATSDPLPVTISGRSPWPAVSTLSVTCWNRAHSRSGVTAAPKLYLGSAGRCGPPPVPAAPR